MSEIKLEGKNVNVYIRSRLTLRCQVFALTEISSFAYN